MRDNIQNGLMKKTLPVRSPKDLGPVADKLSIMFETDVIVVVGSQSILVGWPSAPDGLRGSDEIDAYPSNAKKWEEAMDRQLKSGEPPYEASEHIHALCGEGSTFHEQWGFYVDGVSNETSPLPEKWQERAVYKEGKNTLGNVITIVAPHPEDMIAAKLIRLSDKDKHFTELYHMFKPINIDAMKAKIASCNAHSSLKELAYQYLNELPAANHSQKPDGLSSLQKLMPEYPSGSHCAFYNPADHTVIIRKWDEDKQLYYKIDNPLGPAVVGKKIEKHYIEGKNLDHVIWEADARVLEYATFDDVSEPCPHWHN